MSLPFIYLNIVYLDAQKGSNRVLQDSIRLLARTKLYIFKSSSENVKLQELKF